MKSVLEQTANKYVDTECQLLQLNEDHDRKLTELLGFSDDLIQELK